ncbi:MAG: phosphate signaling complex protein PhoU [Holophaga sp.]|nr:phosphate signaling complex protein PhoU [Holophaga sp.]
MTTSQNPHLEALLQHDINQIKAKIREMARLDEQALNRALQAFLTRDRQLAYSVILRDQYVDELETELDQLCLEFILRHQPAAGHLRFVYAASKIIKELERIGDYAESVGRMVLQIRSIEMDVPTDLFTELASESIPMLHDAVNAFLEGNAEQAHATMAKETQVRQLRDALTTQLVEWRQQGLIPLEALSPLATIARRFERVMEQATNICEEALYSATGEYIKHRRGDGFRILFVDDANKCLSPMAEAIANHLGLDRLSFASCGVEIGNLDPIVARFLEGKGISTVSHAPTSLDQIAQPEQFQLVVALSKNAEKAIAFLPTKTLKLTWMVSDPSSLAGTLEDHEASFQRTFDDLSNHIHALAKAILDDDKEQSNGNR